VSLASSSTSCLVSEHHLHHDKLYPLHIDIYTLGAYCCRKTKHKGDVCIFIHNSIKLTTLNSDNYCLDNTEVCAVHLNSVCDKLSILAIYGSSLGNFSTFLANFDLILYKFFNFQFNFIIWKY
jgi:hypothetical protein